MGCNIEEILKTNAFSELGEEKRQAIRNFFELEKPEIGDVVRFMKEMNRGERLGEEQQRELFEAFYSGLSSEERKRLKNIMDIVKAFG